MDIWFPLNFIDKAIQNALIAFEFLLTIREGSFREHTKINARRSYALGNTMESAFPEEEEKNRNFIISIFFSLSSS